jgi:ATP-binding cassette subfamily F protein uup
MARIIGSILRPAVRRGLLVHPVLFSGILLLVSHDRAFLDNVVTSVLAAEGGGAWKEYAGGYTDWVRQRPAAVTEEKASSKTSVREKTRAKLSYRETRELESLPKEIEALEAEQRSLAAKMSAPEYFRLGAEVMREDKKRAEEIETSLMEKLEKWEKWEALEARSRTAPA